MEMVDYVYNPDQNDYLTDTPMCTSEHLALIAAGVNDALEDDERYIIMRDFDRLFGTSGGDDDPELIRALENMLMKEYGKAVSRVSDPEGFNWYLDPSEWFDGKMDEGGKILYHLVESVCEVIDEESAAHRMDSRTLIDPRVLAKAQILTNALDIFDTLYGPREVTEHDLSVFSENFDFATVELKF